MEPLFYKYFARYVVKIYTKIVYNPTYIGLENIPKEGRVILAGNHTNNFDCIVLMSSTKRCIHFLGKHTLFKGPKKLLFENMGVIPVNRNIKDSNCLKEARKVLNDDGVIGIFPEGTINRKKEDLILPFKMGAIKLAFDTDSYIVPFSIQGEYKTFKKGPTIMFGTPYNLSGNDLDIEKEKLENIVRELIVENKG
jgi:1-acyl-sn-glycerol-3-phosphate acyltransferase